MLRSAFLASAKKRMGCNDFAVGGEMRGGSREMKVEGGGGGIRGLSGQISSRAKTQNIRREV